MILWFKECCSGVEYIWIVLEMTTVMRINMMFFGVNYRERACRIGVMDMEIIPIHST